MALALALVSVLATSGPPDWSPPEPGTYGESMPVVGVVEVDGAALADAGDLVAAFVDGEVRAVAGPSLVGGNRVFALSVAGDVGDGTVYVRAYDAARDTVWDLQPDLLFDPSAPVGTSSDPLVWTPLAGGGPPAWEVDPADYDGSMSITARVTFGGGPVTEAGALAGAFLGGRVRGSAALQGVGSFGTLAFLTVYGGAGEGGDVAFRVYLPPWDRTFAVGTTVPFVAGSTVGSIAAPLDLVVAPGPTLTGAAGWRTLAPAGADAPRNLVLGPVWTQGFPTADVAGGTPNVYAYDEPSGAYVTPPGDVWERGAGRFVYVYEDDDPRTAEVDGGFPKALPPVGVGPNGPFAFALTRTEGNGEPEGAGWNLLGNPFPEAVDWDEGWTRADVSESVYVWDPAHLGGAYRVWNGTVGSLAGGVVPAGNAFWVEATGPAPELVAPATAQVGEADVYGREAATCCSVALALASDDRSGLGAEAFVSFQAGALAPGPEADPFDAWARTPPTPDYLVVGSGASDDGRVLVIDARPPLDDGPVEIPLALRAVEGGAARAEALRVSWPRVDLPAGWSATLADSETGTEVDLAAQSGYAFSWSGSGGGRLALRLTPPPTSVEGGVPATLSVSPARPNPARERASLRVAVPSPLRVRVDLYDALGRRVAAAFDGDVAAATDVPVDVGALAPGVYVVRVSGGAETRTRTLVVR